MDAFYASRNDQQKAKFNLGYNRNKRSWRHSDDRQFLDVLPACAMGAVLGPSLGAMTLVQSIALFVSAAVHLATSRFLLALALGTTVLLSQGWIMSMMV